LWDFDLKATGPQKAEIDLRGATDLNRLSFSFDRAFFRLQKVTARNLGPVVVRLSPGLEVEPATFQINQGRVSLQARLTEQQVAGSLTAQDLAAEWFTPQSVPLQGNIHGQVSLAGHPRAPIIQGTVSLKPGRYQEVDFQSFNTSFTYQDNRLHLSGRLLAEERGPTLSWDGQVPVHLSLMPFTYGLGQEEMRILVQGENINLSLLPPLTREVEDAKGPLEIQANIAGNRRQTAGIRPGKMGGGIYQAPSNRGLLSVATGRNALAGQSVDHSSTHLAEQGERHPDQRYHPGGLRARRSEGQGPTE
jgi:hypothetical protein